MWIKIDHDNNTGVVGFRVSGVCILVSFTPENPGSCGIIQNPLRWEPDSPIVSADISCELTEEEGLKWNNSMDCLESMLMAMFAAGVPVATLQMEKAINIFLEAVSNHQ